ncbi:SdrD B-like domain-containing protein [Actinokineospora sp. NBRC 105648]|uniref:SdrD B-like domain-containing protein n=1 Tax=Actinokineospora sp. NBRC 105648 TaxID=3032206 RepID=UPI0024A0026E|nr:SdrD B-like domain-containing protein [Actinokineospora sp. NBRC 105648]GLZ37073.1 hypothetical protein Acsp05_06980 [Actinokineospora sp. NBRC 105648]
MVKGSALRRGLAAALAAVTAAAGIVVLTTSPAQAAVVRPFTLNYDQELYGDFLQAGNGNSRCPSPTDPVDPFGEPIATCATSQARTYTAATGINDSYYMRWADVDSSAATYNSSTASITIPTGATVDFARLNWAGDTGTIRLADGTVSALPGCNTRQFLAGAGSSNLPAGTPESTSVRLSVGAGAAAAVAPQVISRDALANVPASQPQFYTAYANVTARFAGATTGVPQTITLGNVWTPEGFGCFAGWSLVVVYKYNDANVNAPAKREVFVYDGHVRQSSVDPATTITINGFRVGAAGTRAGLTAYEGDFNIAGDQFSANGTALAEPLSGSATTNYFVSNGQNALSPAVANNMSVDSKQFAVPPIPVGATSANLTFSTSGDTYLAENLVLSVPIPSLDITKSLVGTGPFRPGQPVTYQITVVSPGGSAAVNVAVADPVVSDCDRAIGNLAADVPVTYTCTGPAPADDFTQTATVTGVNPFGDPMSDAASLDVVVINPAIDIAKTADAASYAAGQTITFTITVHNEGDTALTGVVVSDPVTPSCNRTIGLLGIGDTTTYTCTATAPIAGDANTATVTATDPLNGTITDSATAQAPTVGAVSGRVFADRNNNGVFDAADGDTGIGGVTVTLTGTTAGGAPVNLTTTSAPDGTYSFAAVAAGVYTVTETQPPAFDDGIDTPGTNAVVAGNDSFTLTLAGGVSSTDNNFAELNTSSLAGSVYVDADGSGVRDGGEAGIGGVSVALTGTDTAGNAVNLTTTTAADGSYTFPALRPGTYAVAETQPAGYTDGIDAVGSAGGTLTPPDSITAISLPVRTNATGYTFGEFVGASLAGTVVDDAGNPIPGVVITLTGPGGPATATTSATGDYSFTGLPPGTYSLSEAQPAGYGDGPETAGTAGGSTAVNDVISGITLASGATATGYVFAEDRGSLTGAVYEDLDNDGAQDPGEPGIPGVSVALTGTDNAGNPVNVTTTTGPDGGYSFTGLLGGAYTVTETQPVGFLDGKDAAGTAGGVLTPPDSVTQIDLDPGEDGTGYLFGELSGASLAGRVADDGGNGIPGTTVTLTGTDDNGNPVLLTTTTDLTGAYTFTGLRPGTYAVTETQPAGYGDGPDTPGSAGGDASVNDVISGIVLGSGTTATGYLFAEDRGSLSGVVYVDVNNNGLQDPGEAGIPGATVTLTGTDALGNAVNLSTTSAADGSYSFADLIGGTYTVTETQAAGYADGIDTPGTSGGTATPPDSITAITLAGGVDATGYLFGEFVTGSIAGRVVDDGGNGIGGATVVLTGPGGPITVLTGPDGSYTFPNLAPGTYTVTETQPAGYGDGPDTPGSLGGDASVNDVISGIVLPSGGAATGYVFAEERGSLAGVVFDDTNGNGAQDPGEPGIGGVSVTLSGTDALGTPVNIVVTSAPDGSYLFSDLVGGTYTVTEAQPAGYADGVDTPGTSGGTATPPDSITEIALAGGVDATGYTFAEYRASSLAGRVVDDGGNGIAGVTVVLTGPGAPITVTTGPDGSYSFPSLPPGTYTITETQPVGYGDGPDTAGNAGGDVANDVFSNIVLNSGTDGTGYTFAEERGSLAGVVFDDTNNNGAQDPGEPGIGGVSVTLSGADALGTPVNTTVTSGPNGAYTFPNLVGGTYTVTEAQPAGYVDGTDTAGTSGGTVTPPDSITEIALAGGVDATGYTFAEYRASSLAGRVVDDGGNGIPNVTITLTGPGAPITVTTGPDGTYTFPNLPPGTYTITETQPAGYGDGPDTAGSAGGTAGNDVFSNIVVGSGTDGTGYQFAEDRGSLAGVVFDDTNNNGAQDPGEPGIGGVSVTLSGTDAQGNAVNTVVTSAVDGSYLFSDLVGGTYTVTEAQPAGYVDGTDTAGSSGGTLTPPDSITAIDLDGGVDATGYTFGEYRASSLAGRVVDDGGNGIPGVTITLTGPGAPITITTGPDGSYSFPNLPPGTYTITETQPAGYGDGPDTAGTAGGTVGPDVFTGIVVGSGTDGTGYEFAEDRGSLAGVVFDDTNNNGTQDPGEPGIGGVSVTLSGTDAQGNVVNTTVTSAPNGAYTFPNLVGGVYTVTETQPAGYVDGTDTAGSSGGTLTPPDSITAIDLDGGADATGYTFGEYRASTLSGQVVDDGGNGIANVLVVLTGPGGPISALTGPDGTYSFPNLAPSTYTITETQPAGYGDGPDTAGTAGGDVANDVFSNIVVGSGTTGTGYQFAEDRGSLAGVVFDDTNGNGAQDPGEPGIGGVSVTLSGTDAQGNTVNTVVTSAVDGSYLFSDLVGGTYTVTEAQPAGYADGIETAGTSGGTPTPPDSITAIDLDGGVDATGYTFAEYRASSLSGRVVDEAGNGIPGATLVLTGPGAPITITTGPDGTYSFPNLPPGTYTITETQPAGYGDGPDTPGSAGGDASLNDVISGIVVSSGTDGTGYEFAEKRGSLAGVVFDDTNDNGTQDPGEPGISGVSVTLSGADVTGAPVNTTVTSGANGAYTFPTLIGGTYTITEAQPAGYVDGTDTAGTAGGTVTPPDSITEITLDGGVDGTGYTFGEYRASVLSGRVVDDGGNGIPGVTLVLTGPGAPITITTGPDGSYSFPNLPPGTYTITETQPAGYGDGPDTPGSAGGDASVNDVISGIVIGSGTTGTGYTFAEDRGSVSGAVFQDLNNNGVRDGGEPGIGGVTVTLTGTDAVGNPVNRVVTSAPDGGYTFADLVGGLYTVTETQPAGFLDGTDAAGTSGGLPVPPDSITAITLTGGADGAGYTFGELPASSLSGRVVDDGGNPIAGVTLVLSGTDDNGNPVSVTVTTNPDGTYAFPGLRPGTYTITETQPAGYGDGPDTPGSAGGDASVNDVISEIVITPGTAGTGYEFAEERGSLAGVVFDDTNNNGTQDPGEPGIAGAGVTLTGTDAQGNPVNTTVTSAPDGTYTFPNLVGGTYTITETQPAGYADGTDTAGSEGGTPTPPDSITEIALPGGVDATGYTFGEFRVSTFAGRVVDDAGTGIPGVTVTLVGPGGGVATTTGPDGTFSFTDLAPGTYAVIETQPDGYGDGPDTAGTGGGDATVSDVIFDIPVTSGSTLTGYVFAETRGSLAGLVFEDRDGNGTQEAGEPGIPGVTVNLTGTDALGRPVTATTTSGADGTYTFTGLVGGTYAITEVQPAGYADGIDTPGTGGGTLSPPDTITDITLLAGDGITGYTFAELTGAITGTVFIDLDSDGVIDPGEPGRLAGVTVILRDPAGVEITRTTTDANGGYTFANQRAGDYIIEELQPDGYGSTTPNSVPITLNPADGATVNFGDQLGLIGDLVFDDLNFNGIQDPGELGVGGVVVILYDADGVEITRTTTDTNGGYRFTGLTAGTYVIGLEVPDGAALTKPGQGTDRAVDSDVDWLTGLSAPVAITLTGGQISQRTDVDAGLVDRVVDLGITLTVDKPQATIGDTVVFTETVTNTGTVPVKGATTTITIPTGLAIGTATGQGWECTTAGQVLTCTTDTLTLPGESLPPITVTTHATQQIPTTEVVATVSPVDGTPDDNPDNDRAVVTVTVTVTPIPAPPRPVPPAPRPPLAWTGSNLQPLLLGGLLLLMLGGGFLLIGRKRGRRTE